MPLCAKWLFRVALRDPGCFHPEALSLQLMISQRGRESREESPTFNCLSLEITPFLPLHYQWPNWTSGLYLTVGAAKNAASQC